MYICGAIIILCNDNNHNLGAIFQLYLNFNRGNL